MAGVNPRLCSTRHPGILLPLHPPGWDAGPWQGYPREYVAITHLHTWEKGDGVAKFPDY